MNEQILKGLSIEELEERSEFAMAALEMEAKPNEDGGCTCEICSC